MYGEHTTCFASWAPPYESKVRSIAEVGNAGWLEERNDGVNDSILIGETGDG